MNPLYAILIITLASCSTSKDSLQVQPVNESWPNKEWKAFLYEKVKVLPNPKDGKEFCPENGLTRENWVHLFSAMSKFESNYNPNLIYKEKFRNGRGELILSTGLMQISYEQSRHSDYGYPRVTTEQLKDPFTNLDIAVKIMKRVVEMDGVAANHSGSAWRGGSRAWSVLRPSGKLSSVKAYMRKFCQ